MKNILHLLQTDNPAELDKLWRDADAARQTHVGNAVHLRGLIEIGNICRRNCHYCGLRKENNQTERYRMTEEEILDCARQAEAFGFGTVVLQSGEDTGFSTEIISRIIETIKQETQLAVTLSLGERGDDELAQWRSAGADRYLIRFETSNFTLFETLHPGSAQTKRIEILNKLRELGYETGSGMLIGLPGQRWEDLARDLLLLNELDLDMIGLGPFIPAPETPLENAEPAEIPATAEMTYRVLALARILCPRANIPSTTALATLNPQNGHELALQRGANVIMPNITPARYRQHYQIYPDKAFIDAVSETGRESLKNRILALGRTIGRGKGTSENFSRRSQRPRRPQNNVKLIRNS